MAQRSSNPRESFSFSRYRRRLRVFLIQTRRGLRQAFIDLAETLEPILKPLFAINQASAAIRSLIFVAGFLLWVGYAYVVNPPAFDTMQVEGPEGSDPVSLMLYQLRLMYAIALTLAEPLFVPQVFRFVLVISFAFWLASRVAAIYLSDIFDLPNLEVAVKFIRQAAFITNARRLNRLVISEGRIGASFEDSPIYQIGGPGMVMANLENVAVFEKVDGTAHIVSPGSYAEPIEGFERLRKIIDLRDQFIENEEVSGRTKDGIPVTAKGVRFSFSVQRNRRIRRARDELDEDKPLQPLSYTEEAILNLVYRKSNEEFAKIGSEEVRAAIRKFISENSLNQFLADSRDSSGPPVSQPTSPTMPLPAAGSAFKAREAINQELITSFKNSDIPTIDLHWVSVGTWVPPEIIPEKHQEAWERRLKSEAESNTKALSKLFQETRMKEMLRLIQDVPINAFGHIASQEDDADLIKRELLLAYREKIKYTYEIYKAHQLTPPKHLVAALKHLQLL